MASTRNNNTQADYCLQQRALNDSRRHLSFANSANGRAFDPAMPCIGYTPSHMPASFFSNNPTQIETRLFGIGANNLVCPQAPYTPSLKEIPFISFFARPTFVPDPGCVDRGPQRPFPVPQ